MTTQPTVNFTGRDFATELERLLTLLKAELPEYTDWNHSDAGIVILRLLARETDQLNYYIDRVAAEGFLATAAFKQSLIELGGLVGYLPTLASGATTRLRLTRIAGNDLISVPQYSGFTRSDGLTYLTVEAVAIQPGDQSADVDAVQGELIEEEYEAADFTIGDWSGRARVNLGVNVAANFTTVEHHDPPYTWTNVDSFWRSLPTDLHYMLQLNGDDDTVWLVLGDGVQGNPPPAEPLTVSFIRTNAADGNCGHSVISGVPTKLTALITCTNIEPATGGAAAEGTESIRRMIPRVTRTQRRGVTTDDYEALIEHMAGVLHCQALDRDTVPGALGAALWGSLAYGWPHMYVGLAVVPEGGGPMSSQLKEQIWAECASWGHLGQWRDRYILADAVTGTVNVTMRIGVLAGYSAETVRTAAIAAATGLLAPENQEIGGGLVFTDLHRAVAAVAGVSWVEFDAPTGDVDAQDGEILIAGTITATVQ